MEKLIKQYSGQGELIFGDREPARVNYRIDEFQEFVPDGLGGERQQLEPGGGAYRRRWDTPIGIRLHPYTQDLLRSL